MINHWPLSPRALGSTPHPPQTAWQILTGHQVSTGGKDKTDQGKQLFPALPQVCSS